MDEDLQHETTREVSASDEALLKEIRDNYDYGMRRWANTRKERGKDLRYLCGDPWEPEERKLRENPDARRPCINHDELNQYVNQGVNNLRQNKRGIKVEPRGNGANDQTAELRQDLIRTIEYDSKAQAAYLRAGQDMYEGSIGFFRLGRKFVLDDPDPSDPAAWDQEITIGPIPNPDSVVYDPDCKEPDWSDARWCFVVEPMSKEEFKRRYPKAQKTDFTPEDYTTAPNWLKDKTVLVAEYWKIDVEVSYISKGKGKSRRTERKTLTQYITNGIEILESIPQPGKEIPIPVMVGMQRYVDLGSGPELVLFSLPRLARDPQMSLAYLVSQQMEEAGMSPKVPVIGYTGQFDTDMDTWESLNKVPHAFAQVDPVPDPTNPTQVLPLPQWRQFVPNFAAYEVAKESCRRAIQAAMGISPLPTAAARDNEKSGIALDRIQTEQAVGSYHFVEGYNRALERAGRIIESWIPVVYDTEREKWLHTADDKRYLARLNAAPYTDEKGQQHHYEISEEHQHDIGVSTGPSYQSQRDAASDFADSLIANAGKLPIAPAAAAKILSLAIRLKELGPLGDQMADIIDPEKQDQSAQQLQGLQAQFQQQGEVLQALQGELQKLQLEKAGKVIDNQFRLEIERMKEENKLAIAEVSTKAQQLSERMATFSEMMQQFHEFAHERGMQAQEHAHVAGQADQDRQVAAEQAAAAQQQPGASQVQQ